MSSQLSDLLAPASISRGYHSLFLAQEPSLVSPFNPKPQSSVHIPRFQVVYTASLHTQKCGPLRLLPLFSPLLELPTPGLLPHTPVTTLFGPTPSPAMAVLLPTPATGTSSPVT